MRGSYYSYCQVQTRSIFYLHQEIKNYTISVYLTKWPIEKHLIRLNQIKLLVSINKSDCVREIKREGKRGRERERERGKK